jgi:hypothetical protein
MRAPCDSEAGQKIINVSVLDVLARNQDPHLVAATAVVDSAVIVQPSRKMGGEPDPRILIVTEPTTAILSTKK